MAGCDQSVEPAEVFIFPDSLWDTIYCEVGVGFPEGIVHRGSHDPRHVSAKSQPYRLLRVAFLRSEREIFKSDAESSANADSFAVERFRWLARSQTDTSTAGSCAGWVPAEKTKPVNATSTRNRFNNCSSLTPTRLLRCAWPMVVLDLFAAARPRHFLTNIANSAGDIRRACARDTSSVGRPRVLR